MKTSHAILILAISILCAGCGIFSESESAKITKTVEALEPIAEAQFKALYDRVLSVSDDTLLEGALAPGGLLRGGDRYLPERCLYGFNVLVYGTDDDFSTVVETYTEAFLDWGFVEFPSEMRRGDTNPSFVSPSARIDMHETDSPSSLDNLEGYATYYSISIEFRAPDSCGWDMNRFQN